jgi:hypothetical protein
MTPRSGSLTSIWNEKLGFSCRLPDQVHLEGEGLPRDRVGDRDRSRECRQAEITGDFEGLVRGVSLATEEKAICADVSLNDHEQRVQSGRCGHRVRPSRSGPMPRRRQGFPGRSSRFIALKTSTSFFESGRKTHHLSHLEAPGVVSGRDPSAKALHHAAHVHLRGLDQWRQHQVAGELLRDVRSHDRKALREIHPERLSRAVEPPFWDQKCNLSGSGEEKIETSSRIIEGRYGGPTWIRTRDQPVMSRWL